MPVIAYAHRGGADGAPENTVAAFERALALGYQWLETDVHVTRDGVVVAFHDDRLDRVTDRSGDIAALTYAEVCAADAGHWFTLDGGATYPYRNLGVRVPALGDLLERWPGVQVNLDAKADRTVAPLMRLLLRMNALSRVCLASFSDRRLRWMRQLARGPVRTSAGRRAVTVAFLASRTGRMPRLPASRLQIPVHAGRIRLLDKRFVSAAHAAGLAVDVWTPNTECEIREALDLGVDGVMSDRLELLKRVLVDRGRWQNDATDGR
ncbi:MAG: glycerophosphodiester phosphodiesterase [Candidatus Dormibacteraeota bacterium]|nr:glycerophosphodiester phosphodiesterase [Candidatus Dormibacteraeota bacterium]